MRRNFHSTIDGRRDDDYLHISKWAVYQEVYILFINSYQKKLNIEVNEYIIDTDLCLLH